MRSTIVAAAAALSLAVSACSTNGEFYKEGDPVNGDFSVWRTVGLPFAVVGVALVGAAAGYAAAQPTYRQSINCTSNRIGQTVYTNCW